MRIVFGCEYKLSESKILDWLGCFGEVLSEITEERFGGDDPDLDQTLPPVGNGSYIVKMRLVKDLPNWMPMFGRKICLEYQGMRRECSSCYGPHAKKFCRSERVGMLNFVNGFSKKYTHVPASLYGKFADLVMAPTLPPTRAPQTSSAPAPAPTLTSTTSTEVIVPMPTNVRQGADMPNTISERPKIKIALKRANGTKWVHAQLPENVQVQAQASVASVVENVGTFLSGIRASFCQENVYVSSSVRPRTNNQAQNGK